jgi:hypothetical protein
MYCATRQESRRDSTISIGKTLGESPGDDDFFTPLNAYFTMHSALELYFGRGLQSGSGAALLQAPQAGKCAPY